jgi:Tol biopolymer transport system component/predicted Ser/Thr protein kinase
MPLSAGDRLGPYQILEPIGAGGMGVVFKARDTRLDRIVAIKMSNEQFTERFEQEARAVAALNHPNICTLHDVGPNYLVMEYIEGESPKGPMPLDEALRIAHQIADALEAAHERGITHRDLKPANIKIKPDGAVKVLDFGLAKVEAPTSGSSEHSPTFTIGMTEAGMIVGTASYMAPEQARGKPTDKRADIFAFGVVLHELITGRRLFGGEDAGEMLAKVIRDEPDLSDAPPSVRRLLAECLQKDPRKRLRDIGDVWRLLGEAPPGAGSTAAPDGWPETPGSGKTNWLWPAVAAFLVLCTGALAFVHFRESPPEAIPMRFGIAPPPKSTLDAFALSPDGRKLVFNLRGADGRSALWLRLMDSLQARELPGTQGANLDPAWSPDSQSIAFMAEGSLKKLDISGGSPQTLASYSNPATGICWGRQDVILFSSGRLIHRISASGGEPSPVTALDPQKGELGQGRPFLLPDGKHFLYFRLMPKADQSGIYSGSLDAKPGEQAQKRLFDSATGVVYVTSPAGGGVLLFLRGQALMAQPFDSTRLELTGHAVQLADQVSTNLFDGLFTVSDNGVLAFAATGGSNRQLTWFDREGKILGHVGEPAPRDELALSPDGTRVAEGRSDDAGKWVVWMLDVTRGASTRLTFEGGGAGNATWSPDGAEIVYAPDGGNSRDLYRKPASGAGQGELLVHSEETKTPQDWSRDGRFLLFLQREKNTGTDLWALPMQGDRKPFPYLTTPFAKTQARFSPDGRWVVYTSIESGIKEVYVQPFPAASGGKWPVSSGGGSQPRWSRDGKELFYFAPDSSLMEVSVGAGGGTFEPGVPKALFRAPVLGGSGGAPNVAWRWDISPDGKRFLMNTTLDDAATAPVTVVLNWQSGMK